MRRRGIKIALVVIGALTFGVAVAWAGLPNLKTYDATFSSGSTGGGKKNSTTTAASSDSLLAAAKPGGGGSATAPSFTINFTGTGFHIGDSVHASVAAYVSWACFNNGSNVPADGNGQKSALAPAALGGDVTPSVSERNGRASGKVTITLTVDPTNSLTCQGTQQKGLYSLRLATGEELTSGDFPAHTIPAAIEIWATSDGVDGDHQAVNSPTNLPYCADPAGLSACFPAA